MPKDISQVKVNGDDVAYCLRLWALSHSKGGCRALLTARPNCWYMLGSPSYSHNIGSTGSRMLRFFRNDRFFLIQVCLIAYIGWFVGPILLARSQERGTAAGLLVDQLRVRVAEQPGDAVGWRLLGHVLQQQGDLQGARDALQRAVTLDSESTAACYDLGRVLLTMQQVDLGKLYLRRTVELSPGTGYAVDAASLLRRFESSGDRGTVAPANFEVQWLSASKADLGVVVDEPRRRFALSIESGLLFNSNVLLAPISRQLSPLEEGSFQAFVSPDIEYIFLDNERWQVGSRFYGYFNVNEGNLQSFDLQHFEPGAFIRRHYWLGSTELVPEFGYGFSYDAFQGHRFGIRHALIASLSVLRDDGCTWLVYAEVDETEFADDGELPSITSLDGWTTTIGTSRAWVPAWKRVDQVRTGVDVQWADLEGSSFSYIGALLYVEAEIPTVHDWLALVQFGWGYRDYLNFEFAPSRNENIWHAEAKLRKVMSEHWSFTTSLQYDRFASGNVLFDADRYTAGTFLTYRR